MKRSGAGQQRHAIVRAILLSPEEIDALRADSLATQDYLSRVHYPNSRARILRHDEPRLPPPPGSPTDRTT